MGVTRTVPAADMGRVDFPDFLTLMARTVGGQKTGEEDDVMLEALRLLDKEQTGFIPVDVLRHVLTSLGEQLTEAEVQELIQEADKEDTGQVDYKGEQRSGWLAHQLTGRLTASHL